MIIMRLVAFALSACVGFATLGPPDLRPHLPIGQNEEHALAFVLIGLAFTLGYPHQRTTVLILSVVMIGGLELLQLAAPGRHARWEDFLVNTLATSAGYAVIALIDVVKISMVSRLE